ncbi:MAG: hypothetical protein QXG65_03375 [Thermoplasmata archaeon]
MVDVHETPPTPPVDEGADARFGMMAAGLLLLVLGAGFGVIANLLVHRLAPASGMPILWVRVGPSLGPYAWAVLGLGLFATVIGGVLVGIARGMPRGRFVLPGYSYDSSEGPAS